MALLPIASTDEMSETGALATRSIEPHITFLVTLLSSSDSRALLCTFHLDRPKCEKVWSMMSNALLERCGHLRETEAAKELDARGRFWRLQSKVCELCARHPCTRRPCGRVCHARTLKGADLCCSCATGLQRRAEVEDELQRMQQQQSQTQQLLKDYAKLCRPDPLFFRLEALDALPHDPEDCLKSFVWTEQIGQCLGGLLVRRHSFSQVAQRFQAERRRLSSSIQRVMVEALDALNGGLLQRLERFGIGFVKRQRDLILLGPSKRDSQFSLKAKPTGSLKFHRLLSAEMERQIKDALRKSLSVEAMEIRLKPLMRQLHDLLAHLEACERPDRFLERLSRLISEVKEDSLQVLNSFFFLRFGQRLPTLSKPKRQSLFRVRMKVIERRQAICDRSVGRAMIAHLGLPHFATIRKAAEEMLKRLETRRKKRARMDRVCELAHSVVKLQFVTKAKDNHRYDGLNFMEVWCGDPQWFLQMDKQSLTVSPLEELANYLKKHDKGRVNKVKMAVRFFCNEPSSQLVLQSDSERGARSDRSESPAPLRDGERVSQSGSERTRRSKRERSPDDYNAVMRPVEDLC